MAPPRPVENREKKAMSAAFRNQKCPDAKTKRVGHSAFKLGREGKCVTLIGVHPQDTGDARSRVNAVGKLPIAQMMGADFILRSTINVELERSSRTKVMAFRRGITATDMMLLCQHAISVETPEPVHE
jgi:hypothetical protein